MLPRRVTFDDYESEVPTPRQPDSDREALTVARPHTAGESAIFARRSARALYVPSPLPMCELKKAMARADEEATHNSSPAVAPGDEAPPSSAPTRLHGHRDPSPFELAQTSVANPEERRLSSNVDADEEKAHAGWRYPIPPLPALEEFAPIVAAHHHMPGALPVPGVPLTSTTKSETPKATRSGMRVLASIVMSLVVAAVTFGIARGDLTRADAQDAAAAVQRAAIHVAQNVKRL